MRSDGRARPSEHRRYVRVMEDVLDCPKLAQCDGDGFRAYIQILLMLNRSKSRDGQITLNRHALMAATRKGRVDAALRVIQHLADIGLMSVRHRSDVAWILVPKWSELQGYGSPPVPIPVPKGGDAPAIGSELNENSSNAGPVSEEACTQERLQSSLVGGATLTDERVRKLLAIAPIGLAGQSVSPADVRCWYAFVQPRMRARGVKSTWRAALNWWPNVRSEEIREAVRWVRAQEGLTVVESAPREEDSMEDWVEAFALNQRRNVSGQ